MKNSIIIFLMVFAMGLSAQEYKTHTVKVGETIESIAKAYLVTPFDIYALNPDAKKKIVPNSVLIIPETRVKNDTVEDERRELIGYDKHKVRRKETLFSLSQKYSVSIDEIKKANRSLYANNLKKGDRIRIPKYRTITSKQTLSNTVKKYKVQPSEGKWRIAYKFGITVEELEALNPGMNDVIQPGDELNVPNILDTEEKIVESESNYYEVLPKEGFFRLKIKLGLTQEELEALNPELKETGLKSGMVLKVPDSVDVVGTLKDVNITSLVGSLTNFKPKNIALMLPYKLHLIDTDSIEETKAMIRDNGLLSTVLDFHVGVKMALDSAAKLGISTNLKVFDTRYNISAVRDLLDRNDFDDYDAVIGPIKDDCFERVAINLRRNNTPIVAAMNIPKEIYSNVFQTIPDDKLMQKSMIDFVKADSLKNQVVIITDQANRLKSEILKQEFPEAKVIFSRKNKKGEDGYFIYPTELENVFSKGRTIVFLETESNAFASSVISMINGFVSLNTEIVLSTLSKNKAFEGKNIDNYYLSNLKFQYPSVNRDFDEQVSNGFVRAYKKEYGVSPSKYATRGYDLTLDLLLRLAFRENLYEASDKAIETEYIENKFRYNKSLFGGYVNEAVYIVRYDDLKVVEAK